MENIKSDETNIEKKKKPRFSLTRLLGGEILLEESIVKQIPLIAAIIVMAIVYINNRYECQKELLEIDRLRVELKDVKYNALTRNSELMDKSRQSRIEEHISRKGSSLEIPKNPPYIIKY